MTRPRAASRAAANAAKVERLHSLAPHPDQQITYAAQLFRSGRDVDVIRAALAVLATGEDRSLRPLLLEKYQYCEEDGVRRDPGGTIRIAVLRALRPLARGADVALLERAVATYEFLYGEATGDLRAAALVTLNDVDDVLAGYHSVRLLTDQYTSIMSGEPAVTAVRVLASQGQLLPLYAYVTREGEGVADVLAESLRSLTALPASLVPPLVERYRQSEDEIVLLGLFDLLLAHGARATFAGFLLDFLRTTTLDTIYRSLVSALIASRDEGLIAPLLALAEAEEDATKAAILREALTLR